MSEEENKGFKVTDRRAVLDDDADSAAEETPAAEAEPTDTPDDADAAQADGPEDDDSAFQGAPMTFSTLLLSLGTSALAALGDVPDPVAGGPHKNLPMARQTIDILGLLEDKTKGNLTDEEEKLLRNLLYDLRVRYVQAGSSTG